MPNVRIGRDNARVVQEHVPAVRAGLATPHALEAARREGRAQGIREAADACAAEKADWKSEGFCDQAFGVSCAERRIRALLSGAPETAEGMRT